MSADDDDETGPGRTPGGGDVEGRVEVGGHPGPIGIKSRKEVCDRLYER